MDFFKRKMHYKWTLDLVGNINYTWTECPFGPMPVTHHSMPSTLPQHLSRVSRRQATGGFLAQSHPSGPAMDGDEIIANRFEISTCLDHGIFLRYPSSRQFWIWETHPTHHQLDRCPRQRVERTNILET